MQVVVKNVFSVSKPAEKLTYRPFQKKIHNKFLLWHGSRQTSLLANMREGLRVQPNEAPVAGLMFGKGIYLTDCFSKAANQCQMVQKTNDNQP